MKVEQKVQGKAERQSNLELLRIIAMLLIVSGHFAGQGRMWSGSRGNLLFVMFLASGLRIAVNLFLMIGVWFMTDADFKGTRILRLYGVTAFYSVFITALMAVLGVDASKGDLIRGFIPFLGRPLWFSSAYISLIALSPFLKKLLMWEQRELGKMVLLLFMALCIASTVSGYKESYVADCCWFGYIYLFIGYLKKSEKFNSCSKWIFLTGGLGIYSAIVSARWLCTVYQERFGFLSMGFSLVTHYISDIRSLPNYLCAFCVFMFFLKSDLGKNRIINYGAETAFGVYVIHSVPAFHDFLWHNIYQCDVWKSSRLVSVYFVGVVLSVYVIGSVIDRMRIKWIEPLWMESRLARFLCLKIEGFYR